MIHDLVKASKESEAGMMPSEQILTEMGRFNEELAKADMLLARGSIRPPRARASDSPEKKES